MGAHFQCLNNGKYRLVISQGYDSNGKRIRHTKTIMSKNETQAQKELYKFEQQVTGMNEDSTNIKLSDFIKIWIENHAEKHLSPKTFQSYMYQIDKRIIPALGHLKLSNIKPTHVMKFYNMLVEENLSRTTYYCHQILSSILTKAVYWQYIQSNPCKRVEAPKHKKEQKDIYDIDTLKKMLLSLEKAPLQYRLFTHLMLAGGFRKGETVALEWSDIDYSKNIINISKSSQYINGKGVITKEPKTKTSVRKVILPQYIFDMLKEHRKEQLQTKLKIGKHWIEENKIFTQWNGKQMFPDTPTNWFTKFLKENKLEHIRLYDLRHISATLLIMEGENIRTVSKRLGHANTSTTIDVYAHALESYDKKASDKLDKILNNK